MEIGSTSPIQGVQKAMDAHAARATRLSNLEQASQPEKDLAELPSDPKNLTAQTSVIKTKDRMLGDLLDILA